MILGVDVGGTKTHVGLFERKGAKLARVDLETFPSAEHASLESILDRFLDKRGARPDAAGVGVAGPVRDGVCRATNLPWIVDARALAIHLGVPSVSLLNDLEANANGIDDLEPPDFAVLHEGAPGAAGNRAVIAAGTGLGKAGVHWDGRVHRPFASEGGHVDWAPRNEIEIDLLRHLAGRFGHVSVERVLSGPGLVNIYAFLRDARHGREERGMAEAMHEKGEAAAISEAAIEGRSELAVRALGMFVSIYGAEAGNVALTYVATGGVYIGGGIAPKILPALRTPAFVEAFLDKGRFREVLEAVPVRVILNDKCALTGAARAASTSSFL